MGVGIFAARKIALLNSINNLEMMMTQLSSQQMSLSDEAAQIAMTQTNLKMAASSGGQMSGGGGGSIWGSLASGVMGGLGNMMGGGSAMGGIAMGLGQAIGGAISGGPSKLYQRQHGVAKQCAQMDNKLIEIQQKEKRLQMTMKRLETQLSMKNKEYSAVEKGEEKAIERSAPRFV